MLLGKYPIGSWFLLNDNNNLYMMKYLGDNTENPILGENLFNLYSKRSPTTVMSGMAYSNMYIQEKLDNGTITLLNVNENDYLLNTEEEIKEKCLLGSNKDEDGKLIDVVTLDYLQPQETYILSDGLCYSRETLHNLFSSKILKNPVTTKEFDKDDKILSYQIYKKYRKRTRTEGGKKKTKKTISKKRKTRKKSTKK